MYCIVVITLLCIQNHVKHNSFISYIDYSSIHTSINHADSTCYSTLDMTRMAVQALSLTHQLYWINIAVTYVHAIHQSSTHKPAQVLCCYVDGVQSPSCSTQKTMGKGHCWIQMTFWNRDGL